MRVAPENTIAAFDNARSLGADGIELDVHLSRDGCVVVHHDQTLDRTTRLKGGIAGYSADELELANVPALATVLARYPELRVIIELKVNSEDLARAAIAVVRDAQAGERVCIGSFWTGVVKAVRTQAPELATSAAREEVRWALYRSWCRWPAARLPYDGFQIPELAGTTRVVSRRFVDDAHRAGVGVQVWTVDDEPTARRLLGWGVDALISDRPDLILPIVKAGSRRQS